MERPLPLSLVKTHSLFYTTQLQGLEYFGGALKGNYQFVKVLQKTIRRQPLCSLLILLFIFLL